MYCNWKASLDVCGMGNGIEIVSSGDIDVHL